MQTRENCTGLSCRYPKVLASVIYLRFYLNIGLEIWRMCVRYVCKTLGHHHVLLCKGLWKVATAVDFKGSLNNVLIFVLIA